MFTGLIEDVGRFVGRNRVGEAWKLEVETSLPLAEISLGDSIAVNGACLTVEARKADQRFLVFHTLSETLSRTNLGSLKAGSAVNLERAMAANGRFGGHLVSGHVDTVAPIASIQRHGADRIVSIELPDCLKPLVIPKGSVTINGISLTIATLSENTFSVHLIPHTWDHTSLRAAQAGDTVNLEADLVGKYIVRQLDLKQQASPQSRVDMDLLAQAGFME